MAIVVSGPTIGCGVDRSYRYPGVETDFGDHLTAGLPNGSRRLIRSPSPMRKVKLVDRWYRIVVPTYNSARWISALSQAYHRAKLRPIFMVDARTTDKTFEILKKEKQFSISVEFDHPRVESLIPKISDYIGPGWVLRFDDDEFPSQKLIEWLERCPNPSNADSVALQRLWLRCHKQQVQAARCSLWIDCFNNICSDYQWRLFHTERVKYTDQIHTPGFHPESGVKAAPEAYIAHFDWIIRSKIERKRKMKQYDAQYADSGSRHWMYYLPEDVLSRYMEWNPIHDPSLINLAHEFSKINRPNKIFQMLGFH